MNEQLHFDCPLCGVEQSAPAVAPGTQIHCGSCGGVFLLGQAAASPSEQEAAEKPSSFSGCFLPLLALALVMLSAAGVLTVILVGKQWRSASTVASKTDDADSVATAKQVVWSKAPTVSQKKNLCSVGVVRAVFDVVRGKNEKNQVVTSPDVCLAVFVKIENHSIEPRPFQSWSGESMADDVTLTDDQGRTYAAYAFKAARQVQGQASGETIAARAKDRDALLFQVPESVDRASLQYFHLQLPAAACGERGYYRFEIPVSMIDGHW